MKIFKFLSQILIQAWHGLFHQTKDNIDFARFPPIETKENSTLKRYKIKIRRFLSWCFNVVYFLCHAKKFFKSCQLLCDQVSKELFINNILYKLLGKNHIQIKEKNNWVSEKILLDTANQFYSAPSNFSHRKHPEFGELNHYKSIPTERGNINLDCWLNNVMCIALKKQYYFSRNNINIKPELGDIVIDGGGCFGDTSVFFAKSVGATGKVYVFDPLPIHGAVIQKNISQNNLESCITYLPYAISESSNNTKYNENLIHAIDPGFRILDESSFPIISIDEFVQQYKVSKINFIKMDIEGHELLALKGAIQTIKKFMPKLAISIYHRREDFHAIPLWLNKITDGYQYYIDHYTIHAEETVLYAIAKQDI